MQPGLFFDRVCGVTFPILTPAHHTCHRAGDRCLRCNLLTHVVARGDIPIYRMWQAKGFFKS